MSSFGEELRRERELRQISLREISEATKISLRYLDALERDDFRHLPGGVFNKGFVRAYSQFIGIDPETMVNAYLLELSSQESRNREGRMDGGRPGATSGTKPAEGFAGRGQRAPRLPRMWRGIALLLLLLAVVVVLGWGAIRFWRSLGRSGERTTVSTGQLRADPADARIGGGGA